MDERNPRGDDAARQTTDEPDVSRTNEEDLIGSEDDEFEDVDEMDDSDEPEEDVEE